MSFPPNIHNSCDTDCESTAINCLISVIICTVNRHNDLFRTLTYFADEETYSPFEVIVIDQSDETDPMVKSLMERNSDRFKAVHRSEKHLAKARNVGLQLARGDLIVFVDDDVDILPGYLAAHAAVFIDPEIWGGTGPVFDPGNRNLVSSQSLTQKDVEDLASGRNVMRTDFEYDVGTLAGGNMSIRRSAFDKTGEFDEFYENYCDDVEFSRRLKLAGGRLRYTPAAQIVHYGRQTGGVREMSLASYIRNHVRSVVFFERQAALRQIAILRMFRRMILSRAAYRGGRLGVRQIIAFWQGVVDARREFNHRNKSKKVGVTKSTTKA
jgi:GT2 family glycosyltransferase